MIYRLTHALERAASADPDRPALVDGERSLTYAELNERAGRLARLLRELGVRRGDRVGIYMDKSADAVVACHAVLGSGGAYVPLDPAAPVERVGYIAADCGLRVLVSGTGKAERWLEIGARAPALSHVVAVDAEQAPAAGPGAPEVVGADAIEAQEPIGVTAGIDEDLALILYTSGSTGTPKGVMLSHRNVLGFVCWAVEEFDVGAGDRLSQLAPLHFDLSTFDIYGGALAGASVHVARKETLLFPAQVKRFFTDQEISVTYSVPSILTMLVERGKLGEGAFPALHTILFAGEVFPTKYLSKLMKLLPHVEFANLFGPTETNVCTYYRVPEPPPEDGPPISIGSAIANVDTFVVSADGRLASPGQEGELWVRGLTVMQGYWGDAQRTAATLVDNPFVSEARDPCYRTGDLVVEREDGNYTFLGRRDDQVKTRGYRVELGDIEAALYGHAGVLKCAAIAVPDELVGNRIHAVVVARGDLTEAELRSFVSSKVPDYMVPEELEFRDRLPETSTGKIDRQALLRGMEPAER